MLYEVITEMARREQAGNLRAPGARGVAVAPDRVAPGADLARAIEVGLDLDGHRGAERRPGELVRARPLQAQRAAGHRAREQRGVEGNVVGAVVV